MISVSENAQKEMKSALEGKGDNPVIRVFVTGQGCGGVSLGLTIDESKDGDISLQLDGYKVVMEEKLDGEMNGVEVDYRDSDGGSGFIIRPGQVVSGCGGCACH